MSSLKDKLYNYEQTPPGMVWEKIAAALDESHIADEFPSKLYNSEAVPPPAAWDKIISSLDTEHPAVIATPGKSFTLFRYAAAAAITGLIALGVIKWAGTGGDKPGTEGTIVSKDTSLDHKGTDAPNNTITENNPNQENIIPEENFTGTTNRDQVKTTRQKKTSNNYSITENINATQPVYAFNEHTPNLSDRYIMLMTPNGDIIRMSKKWGNLVCCVSGEEQDEDCKDQLKKWQQKLATSPASTTGNFMDILSLVSSLSDNEL